MQTRTYGDLFKLIQSLAGVNSFTANENASIARFINRRYLQAYNSSNTWARYIVPSEERFLDSFRLFNAINYSKYTAADETNGTYKNIGVVGPGAGPSLGVILGSTVYKNEHDMYFYKTISGWIGDLNPANTSVLDRVVTIGTNFTTIQLAEEDGANRQAANPWDVLQWNSQQFASVIIEPPFQFDVLTAVPFEQDYYETIGHFIKIFKTNALDRNSAHEYEFFVDTNGANILNIVDSDAYSVYVTYKKKFTPFTTSSDYVTSTEAVPEEFFPFIAHTAYADFLRMDGQHQKALIEEQTAQAALDLQLEQNDIINNNNNLNIRFSTYVSRQSR